MRLHNLFQWGALLLLSGALPFSHAIADPATPSETAQLQPIALAYAPGPPDNPLKGFIPYLGAKTNFPHSMEWDYTAVASVMTGEGKFDWTPFEKRLNAAAARGHQFYARFYLEYPGKPTGVPRYLIDAGLTMHRWSNSNTQPFPPKLSETPDYENPRLRTAMVSFIRALGTKYDGDPRIGFIGLGLLGTWGEWHNYPHDEWFASKTVQAEVMDAFESSFNHTRLVARYPAGTNDARHADNSHRAIGYHDDSFAWATVHTGKPSDDWFFETLLRRAGALDKWRTQPIGGEVRPEAWKGLFDEPSSVPQGQEFDHCLTATHASWLSNEGVFSPSLQGAARNRALEAARQLGYELYVSNVSIPVAATKGRLPVSLTLTNTGVAPFYYDWPVELAALNVQNEIAMTWHTQWRITDILPGDPSTQWAYAINAKSLPPGSYRLLLRVVNPLPNGKSIRWANRSQDQDKPDWLTLGEFRCP